MTTPGPSGDAGAGQPGGAAAAAPAAEAPGGSPAPRPAPALDDWPAADDFLLREAVEAGAALGAIARGVLPFTVPRSREDITERWRALLYDPVVAPAAATRMARYVLDAKPKIAPLPCPSTVRDAVERAASRTRDANDAESAPPDTDPAGGADDKARSSSGAAAAAAAAAAAPGSRSDDVTAVSPTSSVAPLPPFAEAEQAVLEMPLGIDPPSDAAPGGGTPPTATPASPSRAKSALRAALRKIKRLERGAMAASARFATRRDALGVLVGSRASFYLTKRESALGRGTEDSKVDVDLSVEGNASKVSRQQAFVKLRWNGEFCVRNVGRRPVWINDVALESGRRCALAPQSLVEVGGMRLLWIPNPKLVRKTAPDPF